MLHIPVFLSEIQLEHELNVPDHSLHSNHGANGAVVPGLPFTKRMIAAKRSVG